MKELEAAREAAWALRRSADDLPPLVLAAAEAARSPREKSALLKYATRWNLRAALDPAELWLGDPDAGVRREALRLIGRLGAEELAPALRALLADPDESVRALANDLVARFEGVPRPKPEPEAPIPVKDLHAQAAAEEEWDALDAVRALTERGEVQVGEARRFVGHASPLFRTAALAALRKLGLVEDLAPLAGDPDAGVRARVAAARGDTAGLRHLLVDPSWEARWAAGEGLAELGVREAVPELEARLADPDATVRASACAALGKLGGSPRVLERLADPEGIVRITAAAAIQESRSGGPALRALASHPDPWARTWALRLLRDLGDPEAGRLAEAARTDPHPRVRRAAAEPG